LDEDINRRKEIMGIFKGLVYIKNHSVGSRSEGPKYYLQTFNDEHVLRYVDKGPWELDYYLEFFCRKYVEVDGEFNNADNEIKVTSIHEICVGMIPQDFTNIEWQLASFQKSGEPENSVPNPENYTLAFFSDGTYRIKADCNIGGGNYTQEGDDLLKLSLPKITRVYCGPDSMDHEYLALLENVEKLSIIMPRHLNLYTNKSITMSFNYGGTVEE
jgi:heat shock protein HslJ